MNPRTPSREKILIAALLLLAVVVRLAGLFFILSFLFVWSVYQEGKTKDYILAGLFAGLAFAPKYGGHVLFIPLLLAHLFRGLEKKQPSVRSFSVFPLSAR